MSKRKVLTGLCLALLVSILPTAPVQASSTVGQPTAQRVAFLHSVMPTKTPTELKALATDPKFGVTASQVVSTSITSSPFKVNAVYRTAARTIWCGSAWQEWKSRGLFGTLFSLKFTDHACWDGSSIISHYWHSGDVVPNVTTYGSVFGWEWRGQYKSSDSYYYTLHGHRHGAHYAGIYHQFARCIGGKIGQCISQKFIDNVIKIHYNGKWLFAGGIR